MSNTQIVNNIIKEILRCADAEYITEIYAKDGSYRHDGDFGDWVALMIEVHPGFVNTDLIERTGEMELRSYPFDLTISIEQDMVERGHGTVLWKREK